MNWTISHSNPSLILSFANRVTKQLFHVEHIPHKLVKISINLGIHLNFNCVFLAKESEYQPVKRLEFERQHR